MHKNVVNIICSVSLLKKQQPKDSLSHLLHNHLLSIPLLIKHPGVFIPLLETGKGFRVEFVSLEILPLLSIRYPEMRRIICTNGKT